MTQLVQQGLQRIEALDFLKRDFPQYPWSLRTLDRRLRHFDIFYNDKSVEVEDVQTVVGNELKGQRPSLQCHDGIGPRGS